MQRAMLRCTAVPCSQPCRRVRTLPDSALARQHLNISSRNHHTRIFKHSAQKRGNMQAGQQRLQSRHCHHRGAGLVTVSPHRCSLICSSQAGSKQASAVRLQSFPASYEMAVRQSQEAVKAALADGKMLLEVEFPTTGLSSVSGDGEGQNEMNASMDYLRQFMGAFRDRAASTRVFFPDNTELKVAQNGQTEDPAAGRKSLEPKFSDSTFQLGYLTQQNAMWALIGFSMTPFTPLSQVKDSDNLFVVGYPSFNPREELSATYDIYQKVAKERRAPMVVFNGELDRIRGGYYPGLFFPELAKLSQDFIPLFDAAYYVHNFKGTRPGALFRCYPGPWQVFRRNPLDPSDMRVVWTSDERPTLKQVALDILAKT